MKMDKPAKAKFDWSQHRYTDLERRFISEYLIDHNKAAAAIRAGSTAKEPAKVGWNMYQKEHVKAAIDWHIEQLFDINNVTVERIVRETAMVAFADMAPIYNDDGSVKPFPEWPEHCRRAAAGLDIDELFEGVGDDREQVGFTKKFRQWDKMKALELLGKYRKMWTDKVEISERPKVVVRKLTGRNKAKAQE
ncbi:terminase small subunit [Shewanella sp. SW29]|uniref:terminase small subunit n=2 Tax=unclassified Shewanella TaxID=196818 RepID=UPI0021D81C06|nr:terminase small subunit [Shewanella sp. SW29]